MIALTEDHLAINDPIGDWQSNWRVTPINNNYTNDPIDDNKLFDDGLALSI